MNALQSSRWGEWWPLLPLLLVPVLLPVNRSAELGTLIGLVAGLVLAWKYRREMFRMSSVRLLLVLFACYVGAALWSLPGAVNPQRSWNTFAGLWRFLPFGLYACWVLRQPGRGQKICDVAAIVVAVWCLDAWLQIVTGWSLGGTALSTRVSGVFGAENLKLGPSLAALSPFLLWQARLRWGWRGAVWAFLLLLGPIVFAMSRAAWLQFALVGGALIWQMGGTLGRRLAWLGGAMLVGLLTIGLAWQYSSGFAHRMERTVQVMQGDYHGLDWALSGRLYIWGTALRMVEDKPVNGVGVRGFRYAYPQYAKADDPFIAGQACGPGEGACHPHQWLLEVAASTGLVGLLLWLVGVGMGLRCWWRSSAAARHAAWPITVAVATSLFPLNTHLAFYSAWWGLLFWWLLIIWCGVMAASPGQGKAKHG